MIHLRDLEKLLTPKELERMLVASEVIFPDEKMVKQEVEVVKSVQRIKKNAFMTGVNRSKLAKDLRHELLSSRD